ncbi:MAG: PQQ-binding-like beta-propeller repeat protein [Alphaproteobacteria bacterium]|nr:PQQ-binding-like beta-propeller repeat protein [Alphaproteobacteria bacterium]
MSRRIFSVWIFFILALVSSGCSQVNDILGRKGETALKGVRIPILLGNEVAEVDKEISDVNIVLSQPIVNQSWPQQGGLAHHSMGHLAVGDNLNLLWSVNAGNSHKADKPILSGPVVSEGKVYTLDANSLVSAYNSKTGSLIWKTFISPKEEIDGSWGGGLAIDNNLIIAAGGFAEVVALNSTNGKEIWRTKVSGPVRAAPSVLNGRVFVVTKDNQLYAIPSKNRETLWTHSGFEEFVGLMGSATPAAKHDIVVVPYSSGELYALRVENGQKVWGENLAAIRRVDAVSALADIRGRPVINRGKVYAISHSGRMMSIDLYTGRRIWEVPLGGVNQPWISGEFLFVLTNQAKVAAVKVNDGRIRWLTPLDLYSDPKDREGRISWSGPILAGGKLILSGSHGLVLSLSPYTGKILKKEKMKSPASLSPAIANRTLFYLTDKSQLIAYR